MTTLLVADDEPTFLDFMVRLLQREHNLLIARNWNEVLEKFESNLWRLNATILDVNMPGLNVDPFTMISKLLESNPTVPMIIISGQDIVLKHEFLRMGVFQYHGKPIDMQDLKLSIKSAMAYNRTLRKLESIEKDKIDEVRFHQRLLGIVSEDLRERVQGHDNRDGRAPILIRCETGCRPHMLARTISQQIDGGLFFQKVCTDSLKNMIPHNLQDGDTLFLEGIEHLAREEQDYLSNLLQDMADGGSYNGHQLSKFRLIASISNQIEREMTHNPELAKLVSRLGRIELRIEPLRLRRHELREVITLMFDKKRKDRFTKVHTISEDLYELLIDYNWPLNFDELDIILETLLLTCSETIVLQKHLHQLNFSDIANSKYPTLDDMADEHIRKALRLTLGNKSRAAKMLGITPKTLYARIRN